MHAMGHTYVSLRRKQGWLVQNKASVHWRILFSTTKPCKNLYLWDAVLLLKHVNYETKRIVLRTCTNGMLDCLVWIIASAQ